MNGRTNVTNSGNNIDVMEVPLDPVTNFVTEEGTGKVLLSWTDPLDKYATPEGATAQDPQQLVSVWSHTVIVRKEGSDPVDENDGVVVLSSSVRNQYQSTQYTDSNVENGIEYHYGAFAINEDGIASDGVYSSATPRVYDTILANNTWAQIDEACSLGIAESFWEVGDEKSFTINNEPHTAVILDFNHDDLSDGSGKAAITFGMKGVYGSYIWNSDKINQRCYKDADIRSSLNNDIYNILDFKENIKSVKRHSYIIRYMVMNRITISYDNYSDDKIFLPSMYEVITETEIEFGSHDVLHISDEDFSHESKYPYYATKANLNKRADWWLSTAYNRYAYPDDDYGAAYIDNNGYLDFSKYGDIEYGISFCFCIGKSTV